MDVNAVNASTKTVQAVSKPPPAAATPNASGNPGSTVNSPAREDDSVTLSAAGKLSLKQANSGAAPRSTSTGNEPRAASSSLAQENVQRKLSVTEDRQVVLKIIDPKTKDVIKQIPAEEEVKLRQAVRNLLDNLSAQEQPAK
ncbi:MAG: flagellar protein FlaG [Nitrospinales bacterium]